MSFKPIPEAYWLRLHCAWVADSLERPARIHDTRALPPFRRTQWTVVGTLTLIVALMGSPRSNAGSPYYQGQLTLGNTQDGSFWVSGWQADAESACASGQAATQANPLRVGFKNSGAYSYRNWSHVLVPGTFPYYGCNIVVEYKLNTCTTGTCWYTEQSGANLDRAGNGAKILSAKGRRW
jgi:hypothetical protein